MLETKLIKQIYTKIYRIYSNLLHSTLDDLWALNPLHQIPNMMWRKYQKSRYKTSIKLSQFQCLRKTLGNMLNISEQNYNFFHHYFSTITTNSSFFLFTATAILQSGLVRCNCRIGVPFKSRRFLPFPKIYRVGEIVIRTYKKVTQYRKLNWSSHRKNEI